MEDIEEKYTLDEALKKVGFGRFQVYLLVICGIGYASGTIELILISLLLPKLQEEWPELTDTQLSYLPSATFFGELIGGVLWGWVGDKYGRRISFIGTVAFSAIFGFASAAAPSFIWLVAFRFILGISLGGNLSVDFVMFLEFVEASSRGFYATFIILFGIGGVISTSLIAIASLESLGWRWYLALCSIPFAVVLVLRLLWKYESPRYLLVSGKTKEATHVLQNAARINRTGPFEGQLLPIPHISQRKGNFADLLSKELWKITLSLSLVWFSITFGYYGITIWLPNYLESKDIPQTDAAKSLLWMGLAEIPGLFMANFLIDRIGRKFSLFIALIGCAVFSMLFAFAENKATVTTFSMFIYFFIVQAWSFVYIFTPELFPTTLRTTAFGVTGLFATVAGIISGPIGGILFDSGFPNWTILVIYSALFVLGGIVALTLPETKKSTLTDSIEGNKQINKTESEENHKLLDDQN